MSAFAETAGLEMFSGPQQSAGAVQAASVAGGMEAQARALDFETLVSYASSDALGGRGLAVFISTLFALHRALRPTK